MKRLIEDLFEIFYPDAGVTFNTKLFILSIILFVIVILVNLL